MTELPQLRDASQGDLALAVKSIGPNSRYGGLLACALAGIYAERAEHQQRVDRLLALTYASDDHTEYVHDHPKGEGQPECPACWVEDIRRVLGGGKSDGLTSSRNRAPRVGQRRWRVGQSYGIHVYEESDTTPEGDWPVATFSRPDDAAWVVSLVNQLVGPDLDEQPDVARATDQHQIIPVAQDVSVPYRPQIGDPAQTTLTGVITAIDAENGHIWLQGSAAGGHVPWTFKLHWGTEFTEPGKTTIYDEIQAERQRAHRKHGETSMESAPVDEMYRAVILGEELGEMAEVVWALALVAAYGRVDTVMNDGRQAGEVNLPDLRRELLQVATMAAAWADRIPLG